ncbi:MAG TPA: PAS domain S-box protein [Blastocatellia bacterium]|nr:PAS domain S-box protein [Blastocatellia bacterium]
MSKDNPKTSEKELEKLRLQVTKLEQAELAQHWLTAIIESAEDAIISKTLDGVITSWNKGAEQIFGYTPEEAIGKPVTILIPDDHQDEEPVILARIRNGERIEHYETIRRRKDGRLINISLTVSPIKDRNGKITGASKIARDITARKQAETALQQKEQELRDFIERAAVGLHWVGPDGIIMWANQTELDLLGYTSEQYIGRHIAEFHADQVAINDILARLANKETLIDHPAQLRCKDGSVRHVLISSNVRWEGDKFIHTRCFTRDITELKHIESEREQLLQREREARMQAEAAQQRAEEASRLKDEFIATVSHELRTPLTSMLGWVRLLRSGKLDAGTNEKALEIIERNVKSQAQLVEDLLDISRIVTGRLRLDVRPLELTSVITAAVEAIHPAAEAKGIRIQTTLDSGAGPVSGDFERLQQVVWNLLSNAVKFTPKGGRVQIHLERINSHVELTVSDTGVGINPQFLPRVFERFTQADSSNTRVHGGLGMGLAIVKSIVELHGGTVMVDSAGAGNGTTFVVRLPIMVVRRELIDAERVHSKGWGDITFDCPPEISGLQILIVDDEADTREMLQTLFEQCQATVETAASASKALEILDRWLPDIIIADIGMPGQNGYELIRQIRTRGPEAGGRIPAVALTAFARVEDRVKALGAGYQMHVAKPVEPGELISIVASLTSIINRN